MKKFEIPPQISIRQSIGDREKLEIEDSKELAKALEEYRETVEKRKILLHDSIDKQYSTSDPETKRRIHEQTDSYVEISQREIEAAIRRSVYDDLERKRIKTPEELVKEAVKKIEREKIDELKRAIAAQKVEELIEAIKMGKIIPKEQKEEQENEAKHLEFLGEEHQKNQERITEQAGEKNFQKGQTIFGKLRKKIKQAFRVSL